MPKKSTLLDKLEIQLIKNQLEISNENDIIPLVNISAKEIWDNDNKKINFAKSLGYDVLVIWESLVRSNREGVLNEARRFLHN